MRDTSLNAQLLRHNAVDPLIFFDPELSIGQFVTRVWRTFVHTGYLRWSILLFVLLIPFRKKRYRKWLLMGSFSLLIGLGSYLWIGGEWFLLQGKCCPCPLIG